MTYLTRTALLLIFFILPGILSDSLLAQEYTPKMNLSQVLKTALQKNPAVVATRWQKKATEKKVWEARSGFLPQVRVSAGYTRYQEPMIITPIHQMGMFPPLDDRIYDANLQLRLPIFSGGRTLANNKAAKAAAKESGAQGILIETQIVKNIVDIFLQAQELRDKHELIAQRLYALRERRRELSLLHREGRISDADFALMDASLQSTLADSLQIESVRSQLSVRLGQLIGRGQPVIPDVTGLSSTDDILPEADLLPNQATIEEEVSGPEIRKAQAQLARARAMKSLAARSFLPEISGFYTYAYRSGGTNWDPIGEWAAGISIQLPLFEGGRRIAGLGAASAAEKAAAAGLENARLQQKAALNIAYRQWDSARKRRRMIAAATQSKQKYVEANRKLYQAGRLPLSELLTQETELLMLQIQERELRYNEQQALIDYHARMGDLTIENVEKILR